MEIPLNLKYTKDHEWISVDGKIATVGITDFAQRELGDIVYVEVETVEESLNAASNNANLIPMHDLLKYLKNPYENKLGISNYQKVPESNGKIYKTFCGT